MLLTPTGTANGFWHIDLLTFYKIRPENQFFAKNKS